VQVPFDATPSLIGGGHDPGTRCGQLRLVLGVGEGGGDQLGEVGQPRLGVRRQRLLTPHGHHDAPQPALDADRHADSGAGPEPADEVG
jgi:hypothetical protein